MILSLHHRFLFVRPRKVAGTSVEMALSTICGGTDIAPAMIAVDERRRQEIGGFCGNYSANREAERLYVKLVQEFDPSMLGALTPPQSRFGPHMAATDVAAAAGVSLSGFRILTISRNPYARVISMLHMRQHFDQYRAGQPMPLGTSNLSEELDQVRRAGGRLGLKSAGIFAGYRPEILRYEHLAADLSAFSVSLGVELPTLPHAKSGPSANNIDPLTVFSRAQIDWINYYLADEFSLLGYDRL